MNRFIKKEIIYILVAVLALAMLPMAAIADSTGLTGGDSTPPAVTEPAGPDTTDENGTGGTDGTDVTDNTDGTDITTGPAVDQGDETTVQAIEVKAVCDGMSRIKVSWTKAKGSSGYDLYRSTKQGSQGTKIYTAFKANKTKYLDTGASINKKYYYTVKPRKPVDVDEFLWTRGVSDGVRNTLDYKSTFKVKAYAYTGGGHTASGKPAQVGRIAVDPNVIKLGTWLYIEGYGLAQACDTGGAIKGKTVDLYMNSEWACSQWGVRYPKVYILN